jgi:ketosteroid isomerase-like protein
MNTRLTRNLLLLGMVVFAAAAQAKALKAPALESWLQKYGAAWVAKDPKAAGALFTPDATYHENAFEAPMQGRAAIEAYWAKVTPDQRDIKFESQVASVTGNPGVATWKASFGLQSNGATIVLDGIFVLEFDPQGNCKVLREWWFVKPG